MFDLFFPLTLAFLAYVAYDAYQAILRAERGEPVLKPQARITQPAVPARQAAQPVAVAAPANTAPKAAKPAPAKPTPAKAAPVQPAGRADAKLADTLRNPATGEVSSVPANYRFAKKWLKDALVSEKLLDRVYKPSELDDAASLKVKEAIDKLRAIKKYQA